MAPRRSRQSAPDIKNPWDVPVPLKKSGFVSLHPEHRHLNVEADLGAIQAFAPTNFSGHVGLADLQINGDLNSLDRLGSGRSVRYQNFYLKGIGRTQLAANWSNASDLYHGTGHMFASAAIREYFVSVMAKIEGWDESIVPCEGLLFKKIPANLKGLERAIWPKFRNERPIDKVFQAITVKPAGFIRHSNLIWLLSFKGPQTLDLFFDHLRASFKLDATADAKDFADAVKRAAFTQLSRFFDNIETGVLWGSLHNNVTIDGRYLDLETPTLLGSPLLGIVSFDTKKTTDRETKFSISEPYLQSLFLAANLKALSYRLRELSDDLVYDRQSRELARQFSTRLKAMTGPQTLLGGDLKKMIRAYEIRFLKIYGHDAPTFNTAMRIVTCYLTKKYLPKKFDFRFAFDAASAEPGYTTGVYELKRPIIQSKFNLKRAKELNGCLRKLDMMTDLDSLLAALKKLPDELAKITSLRTNKADFTARLR